MVARRNSLINVSCFVLFIVAGIALLVYGSISINDALKERTKCFVFFHEYCTYYATADECMYNGTLIELKYHDNDCEDARETEKYHNCYLASDGCENEEFSLGTPTSVWIGVILIVIGVLFTCPCGYFCYLAIKRWDDDYLLVWQAGKAITPYTT